jgi:hypothetical protein
MAGLPERSVLHLQSTLGTLTVSDYGLVEQLLVKGDA